MRAKHRVIERFPDARLVAIDYWEDGSPRYQRVVTGGEWDTTILDVHDWDGQQGATAAWRSAHSWCKRHPA